MLPNVRLMIAATLTAVIVLICGFGLFAAMRVSHEPFERMPTAAAPLQLPAARLEEIAAAEPFDYRFAFSAAAVISGMPTPLPDEQETASAIIPVAGDPQYEAAEAVPVGNEDGPTPQQLAAAPGDSRQTKTDEAAATTGAMAPAPTSDVAAITPSSADSSHEASPPLRQTSKTEIMPVILPSAWATPEVTAKDVQKEAEKNAKRVNEAARTRRRTREIAEDWSFEPSWINPVPEAPPPKTRRAKLTPGTKSEQDAGIGGPFVSAPNR
jgi:hypothetical protein